jgi:hypothetical protein
MKRLILGVFLGMFLGIFLCVSFFEVVHKTVEVEGHKTVEVEGYKTVEVERYKGWVCGDIYDELTQQWNPDFVYHVKVIYKIFAWPVKTIWIYMSESQVATKIGGKDKWTLMKQATASVMG